MNGHNNTCKAAGPVCLQILNFLHIQIVKVFVCGHWTGGAMVKLGLVEFRWLRPGNTSRRAE